MPARSPSHNLRRPKQPDDDHPDIPDELRENMTCADLLFVLEHLPFSRHAQSASTVALTIAAFATTSCESLKCAKGAASTCVRRTRPLGERLAALKSFSRAGRPSAHLGRCRCRYESPRVSAEGARGTL
jgi:hypothetical protein